MPQERYQTLKTFKVDTVVNERFKEECARLGVSQGGILEALMVRWIKFKGSRGDKRNANIYDNGKETGLNGMGEATTGGNGQVLEEI